MLEANAPQQVEPVYHGESRPSATSRGPQPMARSTPTGSISRPGDAIFAPPGTKSMKSTRIKAPHFDGVPSLAAFDFINDLKEYADTGGYSESEFMRTVIPGTLREHAKDWWELTSGFGSWSAFKTTFLQTYLPVGYEQVIKAEMDVRLQDTHEPLLHFITVMNKYYEIAMPETPPAIGIAKILDQTNPKFNRALAGRTFNTMAE